MGMRPPSPAETVLRFQDNEALSRALLLQMIGAADAGNSGTDDQYVEMLGLRVRGRRVQDGGIGHGLRFFG